jgi:hypothetical protein
MELGQYNALMLHAIPFSLYLSKCGTFGLVTYSGRGPVQWGRGWHCAGDGNQTMDPQAESTYFGQLEALELQVRYSQAPWPGAALRGPPTMWQNAAFFTAVNRGLLVGAGRAATWWSTRRSTSMPMLAK